MTRKPALPWTLHSLGAAYYRAGRFDEAIRRFRESQRLGPTWPGQCMNDAFLALAHARLGQLAEARRSLEKADQWLADAGRQLAEKSIGFPPMFSRPTGWSSRSCAARPIACSPAATASSATPYAVRGEVEFICESEGNKMSVLTIIERGAIRFGLPGCKLR